jgi:hypothetical protein
MADPTPPSWLSVFVDGNDLRIEEGFADGADVVRVHAAQARALRDALVGHYAPGGVHRQFDLNEQWWKLVAVVHGDSGHAGLGGGPGNEPPTLLRSVGILAEAALAHVSA